MNDARGRAHSGGTRSPWAEWTAVVLTIGAMSACGPNFQADEASPDLGTTQQAARSRQGEKLQGGAQESAFAWLPTAGSPRPTDPVAPSGARFEALTARYGGLSGVLGGRVLETPAMVGAVFYGQNQATGARLKYLISAVFPRVDPLGGADQYELEIKVSDAATGRVGPLCNDEPSNRAVPAPGTWDVYGVANGGSDRFTFACTSGVIDKCVRWGYPYYKPGYAAFHQACTRMARADYCANGTPHTVSGTVVDLYDRRGVEGDARFINRDPTGAPLSFEAGWAAKGAAVCLSKLRWSTLPLGGYCPLLLPDPRVVPKSQNPRARYCEDVGNPADGVSFLRALEREGALVFNDSAYVDAGLYTWSHSATGERFSTTAGAFAPARGTVSPAPGYTSAVFEGAVYRRDLAPSLRPPEAIALWQWHQAATGEHLTSTATPASLGLGGGYARVAIEGFVLAPAATPPPSARKLFLFRHVATRDYATSVSTPGPGWVLVRHEGWLPR
jgi:hypothetical protein